MAPASDSRARDQCRNVLANIVCCPNVPKTIRCCPYVHGVEEPPAWKGLLVMENSKKELSRISEIICRFAPPIPLPKVLEVDKRYLKLSLMEEYIYTLPSFDFIKPRFTYHVDSEWCKFLNFMFKYQKVANIIYGGWQLILQPPTVKPPPEGPSHGFQQIRVLYRSTSIPPPPIVQENCRHLEDPEHIVPSPASFQTWMPNPSTIVAPKPPSCSTCNFSQQVSISTTPELKEVSNKEINTKALIPISTNNSLQQKHIETRPKVKLEINNKDTDAQFEAKLPKQSLPNDVKHPFNTTINNNSQCKKPRTTRKFTRFPNNDIETPSRCQNGKKPLQELQDSIKSEQFNEPNTTPSKIQIAPKLPSAASTKTIFPPTTAKSNGCFHFAKEHVYSHCGTPKHGRSVIFDTEKLIHTQINTTRFHWVVETTLQFMYTAADRNATKVDVKVKELYWQSEKQNVTIVRISDNGRGMPPKEVDNLICAHNMNIHADILLLTETDQALNIGFVSRSFNTEQNGFVFTSLIYCQDDFMTLHSQQSREEDITRALHRIEKLSPFNMNYIKRQFAKIEKSGTRIFIHAHEGIMSKTPHEKLEILKRGSIYNGMDAFNTIEVDKALLQEMLFERVKAMYYAPQIMIYVQNINITESLGEELARDGHQFNEMIDDSNEITLFLLLKDKDYQRGRSGIFLYNDNQLIEAYVKVGKMIENSNYCRGVVGAIDITCLMPYFGDEILNFKESDVKFKDSKHYNLLMEWLACKVDEYWSGLHVPSLFTMDINKIRLVNEKNGKTLNTYPPKQLSHDMVNGFNFNPTNGMSMKCSRNLNGKPMAQVQGKSHCFDSVARSKKDTGISGKKDVDMKKKTQKPRRKKPSSKVPNVPTSVIKSKMSNSSHAPPPQEHLPKIADVNNLSEGCNLTPMVRCRKCQQRRELPMGIDIDNLPLLWCCNMAPYNRMCEIGGQTIAMDVADGDAIPKRIVDFMPSPIGEHVENDYPSYVNRDVWDEYEVEKILDSKMQENQLYYLVHWTGYELEESTWEPSSNLVNAPKKVQEFHTRFSWKCLFK